MDVWDGDVVEEVDCECGSGVYNSTSVSVDFPV